MAWAFVGQKSLPAHMKYAAGLIPAVTDYNQNLTQLVPGEVLVG